MTIVEVADLRIMKQRILRSYRYQEDVIKPIAELLEIPPEKLEDIIMEKHDMAALQGLQSRAELDLHECLEKKVDVDLRLDLLSILGLISEDDAVEIRKDVRDGMTSGKSYESAIEDAKEIIRKKVVGE